MHFRSAPLAFLSLLLITSPAVVRADDDGGAPADGGSIDVGVPADSAPAESADAPEASPDALLPEPDALSPEPDALSPEPDALLPLPVDASLVADANARTDAISDAADLDALANAVSDAADLDARGDAVSDASHGDAGPDAAPVKLLPDGGANGLIADNSGCSVGHGRGSSGAAALVLVLGLAFVVARRRGRS